MSATAINKRKKAAPKKRPTPSPDNTGEKVGNRFKAGAEWTGNRNGRPKGARSKIAAAFLDDFHVMWETHGAEILERIANRRPQDAMRAAVALLPKEVIVKRPEEEMEDDELAEYAAILIGERDRRRAAEQDGSSGAEGDHEEGEPHAAPTLQGIRKAS